MVAPPPTAALTAFFAPRGDDVAAAWLFGSRARGEERPDSDLDVAVLLAQDPPDGLDGLRFDLAEALSAALPGQSIDLLVLNRAPVDLVHRVLRDGILLSEADPTRRVAFVVRKRNEYWDLLPYLREYRRGA